MNPLAHHDGQSLRGEGLTLDLSGREILAGIDLEVDAGTSLVLVGPSGAGKTVLLLVLAGCIPPTQGRVLIGGQPIETNGGGYRMDVGLILDRQGLVGG